MAAIALLALSQVIIDKYSISHKNNLSSQELFEPVVKGCAVYVLDDIK